MRFSILVEMDLEGSIHRQVLDFLEIRTGHEHVNVVVPRDKALVPDSTEQRASAEVILQAVLFAQRNKGI